MKLIEKLFCYSLNYEKTAPITIVSRYLKVKKDEKTFLTAQFNPEVIQF